MNINTFKRILLNKAKELGSQTISKDEIAIEHSAEMMDDLQRAADRVIALDALSRNWRTVLLVKEALQRLENGTFGTCENCEESIPERRLEAIPWAKYCVRCQQELDNPERSSTQFDIAA